MTSVTAKEPSAMVISFFAMIRSTGYGAQNCGPTTAIGFPVGGPLGVANAIFAPIWSKRWEVLCRFWAVLLRFALWAISSRWSSPISLFEFLSFWIYFFVCYDVATRWWRRLEHGPNADQEFGFFAPNLKNVEGYKLQKYRYLQKYWYLNFTKISISVKIDIKYENLFWNTKF